MLEERREPPVARVHPKPSWHKLVRWPEFRHSERVAHLLEHHLHLVTDSELVRVAIDDVRLESRTGSLRAIELNNPGGVWHGFGQVRPQWMPHHGESVNRPGARQLDPLMFAMLTNEAVWLRRQMTSPSVAASGSSEFSFQGVVPERLAHFVGVRILERNRVDSSLSGAHQALLRSVPLTGRAAGPPVTSAISTSFT